MDAIKILIVEDELIVAHSLKEALQTYGYQVVAIVDSAESALNTLQQTLPDLVLMDITIKGQIDGIVLSQEIQNRFNLPVVYLTAYGDRATLERAKATNPYGYLLKPYRLEELKVTIDIALNRYQNEQKVQNLLKEEVHRARKAKQEFLTNIKHEVRTPMNVIQGFCQILQYEISDQRLRSYLDSISESTEALLKMLENIIELSRIETSSLDFPLHTLNLRNLIWEVTQILGSRAKDKNLNLITEIDPQLPNLIQFDELSLRQIFHHLLDNSLKFTDRGTVTIAVSSREITPDNEIELTSRLKIRESVSPQKLDR